jgi:hypothetical protein
MSEQVGWKWEAPRRSVDQMGDATASDTLPSCPSRPAAEMVVRRVLCIPEGGPTVGEDSAHRIFSTSILLSALRCLLTYVVLPIVPAIGAFAGFRLAIGFPLGVVALVFDVRGIRRFWLADHRWRWGISALYLIVMVLVSTLLIGDILHFAH